MSKMKSLLVQLHEREVSEVRDDIDRDEWFEELRQVYAGDVQRLTKFVHSIDPDAQVEFAVATQTLIIRGIDELQQKLESQMSDIVSDTTDGDAYTEVELQSM
jgi:hypothetical protein